MIRVLFQEHFARLFWIDRGCVVGRRGPDLCEVGDDRVGGGSITDIKINEIFDATVEVGAIDVDPVLQQP